MRLTAIAIDDEPPAIQAIKNLAGLLQFVDLQATFYSAQQAQMFLHTANIDLIFLDVNMPDMTGLQFLKSLAERPPMIIFTTGHGQYAETGWEVGIVDFLRKPISFERFAKACNKAMELKILRANKLPDPIVISAPTPPAFIVIQTGPSVKERILLDDILYIEAKKGNYLEIVLKTGNRRTRSTLTELLNMLPAGQFARIHRSFIIAVNKVEKLRPGGAEIAGEEIPFGGAYEAAEMAVRMLYEQN